MKPTLSAVIPSWHGRADITIDSLARQTWPPDEVEVVAGVSPNGRARNLGVQATTGDILIFIDDDAELGNADAIEHLVTPLLEDSELHITGASKLIPPDSTWFQRWVAREVPRIEHPVVTHLVTSNPDPPTFSTEITTTCCAMRRADFVRTGGFDETLVRGVDTEFFVRARRMGYRFALVPQTWTWHPAPSTLWQLWRKHFLYGVGHAGEVAADPARAGFLQRRPLLYILFRLMILLPNVFIPYSYNARMWRLTFKPLKATTSFVSALGFAWGSWRK